MSLIMVTDKKGSRKELVLAGEAGPAVVELADLHLWVHMRGSAVLGEEPCMTSFVMALVRFWFSCLSHI